MMIKKYKAGEVIFEQGAVGDTMFFIQEGAVAIVIDRNQPSEKQLTVLKAGKFFGEMSLLEGQLRSASAVAADDTVLEEIGFEGFDDYVKSNPDLAMFMLRHFSSRLRTLTADYQEACRTIAKVYELDGVREAVVKADEAVAQADEAPTEEKKEKKGFLARSMEKFKEIYNSGGDSKLKYYNF